MDDKPGRTGVGLDDVLWLRAGIFRAGRRMVEDGFAEDLVKVGSLNFLMASGVDLGGELKKLRDILAGLATSDEDGSVREKVEILLKFIEDMISVVDEIGLRQDDDNSLASFDDLAGERLVELRMGLGRVDEEGADIGLFDRGESAKGGEFLDANFALARLAEASSVKNFKSAAMEADFDAVDIAGSALTRGDEGLLFLAEGVEEAAFADVRAADKGEL